jgi:hypothetical protein
MRLSVFGRVVILTASTLDAETLVLPPTSLASITASSDPKQPEDVFQVSIRGEVEFHIRYVLDITFCQWYQLTESDSCKHAAQADQWIKFFNSNGDDASHLLEVHRGFRDNLALAERSRASTPVKALYDEGV